MATVYTDSGKSTVQKMIEDQGYRSAYQAQLGNLLNQIDRRPEYASEYGSQIDNLVQSAVSRGDYQSRYDAQIQNLLGNIQNTTFSYDWDSDPNYLALRKQYERDAARTAADVLAQASAATGGRASSYAVTAASQAADAYRSQLADRQLELFDSAYNRYLAELQQQRNNLSDLLTMDQTDYSRWQNEYNNLLNNIGLLQGRDETAYGRYQDAYADLLQRLSAVQGLDNAAYGRWADAQQTSAAARQQKYSDLLAAIGSAGYVPTAAELTTAGMTQDEANAWLNYYNNQLILQGLAGVAGVAGVGGGYGGGSRGGGSSAGESGAPEKSGSGTVSGAAGVPGATGTGVVSGIYGYLNNLNSGSSGGSSGASLLQQIAARVKKGK